ncbi:unnamed protein product [Rhizopus stolonifer]
MLTIYKVTLKRNFERKTSYPSNSSSNESELEKRCSVQPSFKTALQSSFDDIISYTIKEDLNIVNTIERASVGSVNIRDFAYPKDSPLHFGNSLPKNQSTLSLSSPDFNGRDARVLFDFIPETEYEIELKAGQLIWVQYRECPVSNFCYKHFLFIIQLGLANSRCTRSNWSSTRILCRVYLIVL